MKEIIELIKPAIPQTFILVAIPTLITVIFGIAWGILLTVTKKDGLMANPFIYSIISAITNFVRSVPFIILLLIAIPLMRLIAGKAYGTIATLIPISIAAIPYFGRLVEGHFNKIDKGIIEAAKSMGSKNSQIIFKVLIPESLPLLINGITLITIDILGCGAMAGAIGGGGLGEVAVRYGYTYNKMDVLYATVLLIVLIVQAIQFTGTFVERKFDRR